MKIRKELFIFLAVIFLAGSVLANAQDARQQTISGMVNKLQQKVLLTADQKSQIISIINSDDSENLSNSRSRIEGLLDERQKVKYDIIKDDWWRSLNRELNAK
jgi:archaellum component FlaG (FlaF/FlaG flagellin family)